MYKISVIMPVYNQEGYLEIAIQSIIDQTYPWNELVLIDDGSTDSSLCIMNKFATKDKRIRIISRENRGLVYSLNEGISKAEGNIIARMDADDYSYPDRFENQINLFKARPELYLIGTNFEIKLEKGISEETKNDKLRFEKNVNEPVGVNTWKADILEDYKILHPTWMIRKELFVEIGGFREYFAEDVEFLFRTVTRGYAVGKVNEILYTYYVSDGSKSAVESKILQNKIQIITFKIEYICERISSKLSGKKYLIWGADVSGKISKDILEDFFPEAECIGYVDGIKTGDFYNKRIYSIVELSQENYDYVFIATNGGRKLAIATLEKMGKKVIEDYFKII